MVFARVLSKSEKQQYNENSVSKDIMAAKQELQEIKRSINIIRDKLNQIASQGERLELTEEIIEISRQLDILIHEYQRKSIEIKEMLEV